MLFSSICIAQVGINTYNPQGVFHIDGASTLATTNPATGSISSTQAIDDVVITGSGDIGLGTISPTAKMEIKTQNEGGAIKIRDGTQNLGRTLISDADGVGTWSEFTGGWFALLHVDYGTVYQDTYAIRRFRNFTTSKISDPSLGSVDAAGGVITVPYTATYRITVFGTWATNRVAGSPFVATAHVFKNGPSVWMGRSLGYSSYWTTTPSYMFYLDFAAGDKIEVGTNEMQNNSANACIKIGIIIELVSK